MLIEVGAIFLIHTALRVDEKYSFYSKAAINIIVLALNFVFSQWIVFRENEGSGRIMYGDTKSKSAVPLFYSTMS